MQETKNKQVRSYSLSSCSTCTSHIHHLTTTLHPSLTHTPHIHHLTSTLALLTHILHFTPHIHHLTSTLTLLTHILHFTPHLTSTLALLTHILHFTPHINSPSHNIPLLGIGHPNLCPCHLALMRCTLKVWCTIIACIHILNVIYTHNGMPVAQLWCMGILSWPL